MQRWFDRARPIAEAMEERILHSADLSPLQQHAPVAGALDSGAYEVTLGTQQTSEAREAREIVFVDAELSGVDALLLDLKTQAQAGRPVEIVLIGAGQDAIGLMGSTLQGRSGIAAVHVFAHGADGLLQLGNDRVDASTLLLRAGEIAGWGAALSDDADLLLYGCDVAQTEIGREFVRSLAQLTGADVAASTDITASTALGGDWELEYASGTVEATVATGAEFQQQWDERLSVAINGTPTTRIVASGASTSGAISHTTSGTDRLILVSVSFGEDKNDAVQSVTYGGQALTRAGFQDSADTSKARAEIWYRVAPLTGANNVVVNFSGVAHEGAVVGVMSFTSVDQATPLGTFAGAQGTDATPSVSVASGLSQLVFAVLAYGDSNDYAFTEDTPGQVERWDLFSGKTNSTASTLAGDAQPSVTAAWSTSAGKPWAAGAVSIRSINTAPTVVTSGGALAYIENQVATAIDPGLTLSDVDSANLSGATVSIAANYAAGQDELIFTNQSGISGSFNAGTGALTLTGAASVAQYQAALRSVAYHNVSDTPSTATRTIAFTASDGVASSNVANKTVGVTAVADSQLTVDTTNDIVDGVTTSIEALLSDRGADGRISLREAIIATNNTVGTDDITLPAGTYTLSIVGNEDDSEEGDLDLNDDVRISGAGAASTVISGGGSLAVLHVLGGTATLSGLTVANGYSSNSGAGVDVKSGATLTMSQAVVRNNSGGHDGAGIHSKGTVNLTDVEVRDNVNDKNGGGIFSEGSLTLTRVTIAGNQAEKGAGLNLKNNTASLTNVTLSGNIAAVEGGGVRFDGNGSGTLQNVTIANNQASGAGGGLEINSMPAGSITLRNVLFANNSGGNICDETTDNASIVSLGNNLSTSNSADLNQGSDRRTAVANLGALGNNGGATRTHALLSGSAAIDAGHAASAPATDQRGVARVGTADIGAFEFGGSVNTAPLLDGSAAPALATVAMNAPAPVGAVGTLVSTLVDFASPAGGLDNVTDPDAGAQLGIAVIGADTSNGSWHWSINGGSTWSALGSVAANSARLLAADTQTRIYFRPNTAYSGTMAGALTIRAWDRTNAAANGSALADTTANGGSTAYSSTTDTVSLVVNTPPSVTTSGSALAYVENATTAVDTGLTVSEVNGGSLASATVSISASYNSAQDRLAFTSQFGIVGSFNVGTGVLALSGSASAANYQTVLRSVTYANLSDAPSAAARTVSFVVNDGLNAGTAATRSITISQVNDASVVVTSGGSTAYLENAAATAVDSGVTVTDVDSGTLGSATVSISANHSPAQDRLAFTDQSGINGSFDAATGVLTLSGVATVTQYQTALRSITYQNLSDAPSTAARTVSFVVNDGGVSSTAANRTVSVTASNDAPVVTTTGSALAYTENATTAVDSGLTVGDADLGNLVGATVAISGNNQPGQDRLVFTDTAFITGSWNAATGVLTLSGTTTVANYQAALRSVAYNNQSDTPSLLTRTVSFSVNDGTVSSAPATRAVDVTAVNDAPQVTTTAGTLAYAENAVAVSIDPGLTITDVDHATLTGATVRITANHSSPQDQLVFSNQSGISGSFDAATGVLTLSGTASLTDYQAALRSVAYLNDSDAPSTLTRTISFTVDDGTTASTAATRTVSVAAVNDAPVVTTPAGQTTLANTSVVFSSANGNAITFDDVDAGAASVRLTLAVTNGTLTLGTLAGLTFSTGDGTADANIRFNGTLSAINAALNGLRFDPTANYTGTVTLTVTAEDLGNSGSGGALTHSDQVLIEVLSSNSAPVLSGANNLTTIAEDAAGNTGTLVSALIATRVTDPDAGALSGIAVTAVDNANGQWQYSSNGGSSWTSFGTPTAASARLLAADANTRVRFVPAANWNGSVANGISFRAWDQRSGTVGGTADTTQAAPAVRDEFTSTFYGNNDSATANWSAAWVDSDGSASGGQISIGSGNLNFAGGLLSSSSIYRQVNLAGATAATLSFDFNSSLGLSTLTFEVSRNGGASWTTLQNTWASGSNSATGDLTAYIAANTRIRFSISGLLGGGNFSVDNLQIAWTRPLSGGSTAFSSAISSSSITVTPVNDAATGLPTISGSATENQTLSAVTSGLADIDGLGTFGYQWLRNGAAISGATASSLLLGDADVGSAISVRVNWTDVQGSAESVTSAATAAVGSVNDAPTGLPSITGSAVEDATLSASVAGIADVDGLGAFSYQWLRDGTAISGATGTTLLLGDADVGKRISVRVNWTDGQGTAESLTSAQTTTVANVNDAPTGVPTISGSAIENQTLSAVTSGLADADGLGAFSYQWLRNGSAISGATASTLLLGDADVGQAISVRVGWTDGNGTAESLTSAATAAVVNVNDAPTGLPTISGSAAEYQTLTALTGAIADADGLGAFGHQWLRNGVAISGATASSLVLGAADIGTRISVRINWTDGWGTNESLTSAQTAPVANTNDAPTGLPTITGSPTEDATLGIDTSAIGDIDGLGAFSYQWLRDGTAITGATGSTLLLGDADVGKRISVRVNWTDAQGTAESLTSAQTATVANINDAPTGVPTIGGSAIENQTLGAVTSGLGDIDGLGTFGYQWLRNGVAISGATGSSLLLGDSDVGRSISVRVNWTDAQGSAESVTSSATTAVGSVNDVPTGLPSITGSAVEDSTLSASVAGIADADGLGAFSYQWLRDGTAISGATGTTLLLGDADVGKRISVRVNWTDGQGTAESLTSAQTTTVANVNDAPTGLPTISGSATENQTLSAVTSGVADIDGLGAFSYQWLRNGSAISGATGASLLLGDADVGQAISVRAGWTDGNGTAESLTSAATAAVANVNDAPTGLPTISGSAAEYQTLTALTGAIADADGLGAFSHQWLRNGVAISGATASTLVLGAADIGTRISVRINWTDGWGTNESLTSAQTAPVVNTNDAPTGLPTITGSPTEDATLGIDTSAIGDIDGLGAFSYQWLRDGTAITGATGSTLQLGDADVGRRISVRIGWTDGYGATESVTSGQTATVANINDAPTGAPAITGSAIEDRTLGVDVSSIADIDGLGAFGYQWLRDGVAIGGATGSTLRLGDADVGKAIAVRVNWTDARGTAEMLTSAATGPVLNINDAPRGNNTALPVFRNGSRTLAAADFGFVDFAGESNALQSVRVLLPSAGTLRLAGNLLTATTEVTRAQLDAGELVYAAVPGASGNGHATVGFQLRDDGGTVNGGVDIDPVVRTLTIDIVNRAPTITSNGGGASGSPVVLENTTAVTSVSATDADGDPLVYSIVGGADAARMRIDTSTGALRFIVPPNAEAPTDADADDVYRVTVRASDGVSHDEQTLSVRVTDVLEAIQNTFETRVNTTTADSQLTAMANRGSTRAVALAPNGSHVVVWSSLNQDGGGWGVYGQRFDAAGAAVGGEFRINQTTSGDQFRATVATDAAGNFVVAWTTTPGNEGMRARLYGADGITRSGEIQVNSYTTGNQTNGSVAMDANGNFIVVWQGVGPTDGDGIFARRFDAAGTAVDATEFRVNTDLLRPHYDASVSMNASGAFAIAWDNGAGVQLRMYGANGSALTGQIVVSTGNSAGNPALALSDDGAVQLVWRETATDMGVYLQRYSAGGALLGGRTTVNTVTSGDQTEPSIAVDGNGRFVVAWEGIGADDDNGVFLQKFDASGARIGGNVLVNQTTTGAQNRISVAMLDPDNLVAVWSGRGVGDSTGVFMRQYGSLNSAPQISGVNALASVAEDSTGAAGTLVSALLSGRISDPDPGALAGIAVVGIDNSNGVWQYSVNGGSTWTALGARSDASARLLAADSLTRVRFVPAANWHGSVAGLSLRAWDRSSGSADTLADTGVNGGISAFSSQTVTASVSVTPVADAPTGLPVITGSPVEDGTLTALTGSIGDADGLGPFGLQWLRNGAAITGATGTTYQPGDADVGRAISVRVSWTDGDGSAESLTSAPTAPVANVNDAPTGLPVISGSAIEDATLTAVVSGIADVDGLGSFSRQWLRDGVAIGGATGATYRLGDADVGARIGVRVSWTDGNGTAEVLTSAQTAAVANVNDVPTGAPTIAGSAVEDALLRAVVSGIADADGLGSFAYQWLRDGVAIAGATGETFVPGDADVGRRIGVLVGWTDGRGTAEVLTSAQTAPVANVNDVPTGAPLITGSAIEDGRLGIDLGPIGDADGLGSFGYQWLRDGSAIAGATGTSLLLGDADVGRAISVRVNWTDGNGTAEVLTSAATAAVVNVNDVPVLDSPQRDRRAVVGDPFVLTLPASMFSDIDPGDRLVFSATTADGARLPAWLGFDAATRSFSGTPERADVGGYRIRVTATDTAGASVSDVIDIEVVLENSAPRPGQPVGDREVLEDAPFRFALAPDTFVDTDHRDVLELRASLASGAALPPWLTFDAASASFSGVAANADVGSLRIRVTATDLVGATGDVEFSLQVVNVNDAPVATAIADQRVRQDEPLRFVVPPGTFSDIDAGDTSGFDARLVGGGALPAWLRFDGATQTFSGTPGFGDVGTLSIRVTATDSAGASVWSDFDLVVDNVNDAPVLAASLPALQVDQGNELRWTLPADSFTDVDTGDALSYAASLAGGAALPGWLRFDAATRTFVGTPGATDIGVFTLRIVATDLAGATASGDLTVTVINVNDAPVATSIADQRVRQDELLRFAVPAGTFSDIDAGDTLGFDARLVGGGALPAWLRFDGATQAFSGTPGFADIGTIAIRITATDAAGARASSDFSLTVDNVNDAPNQIAPLPALQVDQGSVLSWTLPEDRFADVDAGDVLGYSVQLASGGALPEWLRFDAATRTLSGTPGATDIGALTLRVVATDAAGASASGELALTVRNVNDAPVLVGTASLPAGLEDATGPAMLVRDLIAGRVMDADSSALAGVAVISADEAHGRWQYSLDGATWNELGAPTAQQARLLAADATTAVRFVPVADWHGEVAAGLVLRAWDRSSGSAGEVADASAGGGSSAYSAATAAVAVRVLPVNDAPVLVQGPLDQSLVTGERFDLELDEGAFADRDAGDVLSYSASLADGKPLPNWLQFDSATLTFKGNPSEADIGVMTVRVTATDAAGATAQALFVVDIDAAPAEPQVETPLVEPMPDPVVEAPPAAAAAPARPDAIDTPESVSIPTAGVPAAGDATEPSFETMQAPASGVSQPELPTTRADAVLATLPAAVFSELKVEQTLQLLRSEELLRRFDDLKHQMKDLGEEQRRVMASSLAITSGLSIGYVVWLVRGGVLVSSMLSALPAWQLIDPMPVLAAAGAVKKRLRGGAGVASGAGERDVEELFDGQETAAKPPTPTRESRLESLESRTR